MQRKAKTNSRGGTRTPDPLINRQARRDGSRRAERQSEGTAAVGEDPDPAGVSHSVSRDLSRLLAVVPEGIGAPLPDLAEAADLTMARATQAIKLLEQRHLVICARRLAGSTTIPLFSRVAA